MSGYSVDVGTAMMAAVTAVIVADLMAESDVCMGLCNGLGERVFGPGEEEEAPHGGLV